MKLRDLVYFRHPNTGKFCFQRAYMLAFLAKRRDIFENYAI